MCVVMNTTVISDDKCSSASDTCSARAAVLSGRTGIAHCQMHILLEAATSYEGLRAFSASYMRRKQRMAANAANSLCVCNRGQVQLPAEHLHLASSVSETEAAQLLCWRASACRAPGSSCRAPRRGPPRSSRLHVVCDVTPSFERTR